MSSIIHDNLLTDGELLAGLEGFAAEVLFSNASDNWATPQALFQSLNQEFDFRLDVAANSRNAKCKKFFAKKENGLTQNWHRHSGGKAVYCNPPYGKGMINWLNKAYVEGQKGCIVVCLVPFRTDTKPVPCLEYSFFPFTLITAIT
jgi:phage N-6-adenine-methyltransferase